MKSKAEETAREMVGDGQLPNMYWVSAHNQWMTNKNNEENCYDWSGEVYKDVPEKSATFGPYKTFAGAFKKMEELAIECPSPEDGKNDSFYTVTMEDRLSGQVYSAEWNERWFTKNYRGEDLKMVKFFFNWADDTQFSRKKLAELGVDFK